MFVRFPASYVDLYHDADEDSLASSPFTADLPSTTVRLATDIPTYQARRQSYIRHRSVIRYIRYKLIVVTIRQVLRPETGRGFDGIPHHSFGSNLVIIV